MYAPHNIQIHSNIGVSIDCLNDPEFITQKGVMRELKIRDADLKPDKTGKYFTDITELDFNHFYPGFEFPEKVEIPVELIKERARQKRLKILGKRQIAIDWSRTPELYYFFEGDRLQLVQGDNVIFADSIEIVHGRKAVNVEALELGHPYLELPEKVAGAFEEVLREKELESLKLLPVGKSLLNGHTYYRLSVDIPPDWFSRVASLFEFFNGDDEFQGQLTMYPTEVSQSLSIPIA